MRKLQYNLGIIFIIVLAIIPVMLWFFAHEHGALFTSDLYHNLQHIGQLLGIIGFSLFAINIILSARMHFLEKIFYGLNKVYEYHALIGKTAFYLMLFHPLTLFFGYNGLTHKGFFAFFTPGIDKGPINFGIFALLLLIILISLTIYLKPKYHIWKWTHKFLGVALFLGALHAFLMPSTVANFAPLKFYMLVLFVLSMCAYLYHSILGRFLRKKYKYVVSEVKVLGGTVTEVSLRPVGDRMNFIPGQFAFISFVDKEVSRESHPFSLTSVMGEEIISFNMKNLGDYTSTLPKLSVGSQALIDGPYGKFSFKEAKYKKQIWVAGGIGVTPFLSMIGSIAGEEDYSLYFYYCLKNEKEAVHLEDLKKYENEKIKIIPFYSDTSGFINADTIKKMSGGLEEKDIFLCAPPVMVRSLRKQFKTLGVEDSLLHSEEFNLRD